MEMEERENHGVMHASSSNSRAFEEQQNPSAAKVPFFERTRYAAFVGFANSTLRLVVI